MKLKNNQQLNITFVIGLRLVFTVVIYGLQKGVKLINFITCIMLGIIAEKKNQIKIKALAVGSDKTPRKYNPSVRENFFYKRVFNNGIDVISQNYYQTTKAFNGFLHYFYCFKGLYPLTIKAFLNASVKLTPLINYLIAVYELIILMRLSKKTICFDCLLTMDNFKMAIV